MVKLLNSHGSLIGLFRLIVKTTIKITEEKILTFSLHPFASLHFLCVSMTGDRPSSRILDLFELVNDTETTHSEENFGNQRWYSVVGRDDAAAPINFGLSAIDQMITTFFFLRRVLG